MIEGIMVVNKPKGITSHDVVDCARRKLGIKKIGHAGTLDPLATGVLVLLVGRKATKLSESFLKFDKAYRSTMILGTTTETADTEGKIVSEKPFEHIVEKDILSALDQFRGDIEQVPPMYSAIKHKGRRLYQYARKGITIEREPRQINVSVLEVENVDLPNVQFYMECSTGTYVRQIAEDIGNALGCGACISKLERTSVGLFTVEEAVNIEDIHESHLRDWQG